MPTLKWNGPDRGKRTIALAHGAGAGMDSLFLATFAEQLAGRGIRVARFEFPYMERSRTEGKSRPPDREPKLRESWLGVVTELRQTMRKGDKLVISGKSMGGRIASLIADEAEVDGLVCLGYPFHPTGRPEKLRVAHLAEIATPTLIVQGERDAFGNASEVSGYDLNGRIEVKWLPDGDHSFKPRKASGLTQEQNWEQAIRWVREFVSGL